MTKKGASAGGSKGVILGVAGAVIALAGFLGWRALQPLPEVAPTAVVEQGGVAKQGGVVKQDRQQAADGAAQTPAVVKPVTVKPVVVKPVTVKPVVVKPVVVKPVVAKPVTVKPVVVKPADASNKGTQTGPAKANVAQEGAPSVVSGSVQPQGVNKAARAQAETSPPSARVPPAFDVVRVDAQGNALVAGTGEPGARISVFLDDTSVAQTNADSQGKFVAMFKVPTGDKPHVLSLSMDVKNGSVLASVETIALAPISPPPPVAPRVIAKASGAAAPAKPRVASQSAAQPQPQPGTSALTTRRVAPQEADKTSNKAAQVASSTASAKAITTATTPATTATTATTATATTATATTATASTVATATTAPAATPPMTVAQTAEAQTAAAQTAAAQTAEGQTAAGQTAAGQTAAGQTAAGQTAAAQTAAAQTAAAQTAAAQTAAAQTAAGQTAAGQTAQGQTAQGQTAAGQTAAGQTAEAQTAAPSAATEARAPAILMVEKKGVKLLQPAGTGLDATKNVVIDVISYDDAGDVSLAGRGTAKDFVRIYLDNRPVGTARIGADGTWHSPLLNVASGIYALRVDQLDAHGKVTSRMETPFKRESKAVLARAAAQLAKQNGVLPQGGAALHTGAANQAATAVQARALQGASPAAGAPVTKETAPAQVAQMTSKSVPPVASSGALPAPRVAAISAPVPPQNPGSGVVPRQGVSAAGSVETGDQTGGGVAANAPVLARPTAVAGTAPKRAHLSVVTVQPGFTLWRIARENYGLGHLYVRVYNANRAQIRNPDLIYPGQVFTIPDGDTPPPQ